MTQISYTNTFTNGTTADASQVQASFDEAKAVVNGNLDAANLSATVAANLGLSRGATASRGKSIIATTETRSSTSFGTLTTADSVSVTLPASGLIFIAFQATWQESVANAASAALFIGSNQLKIARSAGPVVQQAATGSGAIANQDATLSSFVGGLASLDPAYSADVTTGQIVGTDEVLGSARGPRGGHVAVFAAAGTYAVSVQFKASSGTVTAKNRKLWCWTIGFD